MFKPVKNMCLLIIFHGCVKNIDFDIRAVTASFKGRVLMQHINKATHDVSGMPLKMVLVSVYFFLRNDHSDFMNDVEILKIK